MGLLDTIMNVPDNGGNFEYLQGSEDGTRYVVKLIRGQFDEPGVTPGATNAAFKADVEILYSSDPAVKPGSVKKVNPPNKFMDSLLAVTRRFVQVAETVKSGKPADPFLGLTQGDKEKDKEFAARVGREYGARLGPSQPLAGAVFTIVATKKGAGKLKPDGSKGSGYTAVEPLIPSESDLKNAGLI